MVSYLRVQHLGFLDQIGQIAWDDQNVEIRYGCKPRGQAPGLLKVGAFFKIRRGVLTSKNATKEIRNFHEHLECLLFGGALPLEKIKAT
jgi:hypothetical protein